MEPASPALTPVADHDALRRDLATYLHRHAFPAWSNVEFSSFTRAANGLSWETFIVDAIDPRSRQHARLVVKRPPPHGPLAPYDVTKEEVLVREIAATVPVPQMLAFSAEPQVGGRPLMVMGFVEGDIPDVRNVERWAPWQDPETRRAVGEEMLGTLAKLQTVPSTRPAISECLNGGRSVNEQLGATIDRLMGRLDEYVAPTWIANPVARDACLWLHDNMPVVDAADSVIVHGDFRLGNVIWDGVHIAALLDWERASVGDRMQDLAFFCMPMARQRRPDLLGMLLTREQLFSSWERLTGRAIDLRRLHYFLVYWQYVELAQVLRGIVYMIDSAPPGEVRSLTSYPLVSAGTVQLIELIERFEDGDHDMR